MLMPPKSLSVSTSRDWYHKLVWEEKRLARLRNDGGYEFAYSFINAAITAWHVGDWAYSEFDTQGIVEFPTMRALHAHLQEESRYLKICREVADGSKHAVLRHFDETIGTYSFAVQLGGELPLTGCVMWCIDDRGIKHQPMQVIRSSLYFWTRFLSGDMKRLGKPGTGLDNSV